MHKQSPTPILLQLQPGLVTFLIVPLILPFPLFSIHKGSHIASEMSVGSFALAWHADIPSTPTRAANVPISGLLHRGVWEVQNTEERETAERGRGREMDHINGSSGPAGGSNDGRETRSRPWCATSASHPSCLGPDELHARKKEGGKG
ncbi:hypothetical protein CRENBAI_021137 [Crenichthys baileyi]|uniref:Uncharacterized protein n=1 Tax=Crenichthys baileyi TaxID=28760 RepID=A0AAV9RCK4_9TELE